MQGLGNLICAQISQMSEQLGNSKTAADARQHAANNGGGQRKQAGDADASLQMQAGWELAGLATNNFDKQAADQMVHEALTGVIKTANDDAVRVAHFLDNFFHFTGKFDSTIAIRNMYAEAENVWGPYLSVWVGSRMYRGDDIYLLDFWPLDNLNTVGAGTGYTFNDRTSVSVHMGLNAPDSALFQQSVLRPPAQNQFGATDVTLLDRQHFIGSMKASHIVPLGATSGLKGVAYAEVHELPEGQRETRVDQFETLPSDGGYVIGAQIGAFTGERDTHLNLVFRYARGLAAGLISESQLPRMHGKTGAEKLKAYFSGPICEQRRFPGMLYTIAIILLVLWLAGWLGFQQHRNQHDRLDERPLFGCLGRLYSDSVQRQRGNFVCQRNGRLRLLADRYEDGQRRY